MLFHKSQIALHGLLSNRQKRNKEIFKKPKQSEENMAKAHILKPATTQVDTEAVKATVLAMKK